MKTKKNLARVLAALLALAMLMCAVGCSKGENTTGDNTQSTSSNNTPDNTTTTAPNDGTTGGDNTNTTAPEDDEPDVYVISGVWKFNDTVTTIEFENPDEEPEGLPESMRQYSMTMSNITYSSNGQVYEDGSIRVIDTIAGTVEVQYRAGVSSRGVYDSVAGWTPKGYQTVDFGDVPQEVSKDFYNWMKANAVKQ